MNQRQKAALLILCALALAVGAYFIITRSAQEGPAVRQPVAPPSAETATAPAWVGTGQTPEPDYSSADAQAQNATPLPEPTPKASQTIEVHEDATVTLIFVKALSNYLVDHFVPLDAHGKPATTASVKSLNIAFGQELTGFAVNGDDIRKARETVFSYAFTPEMIQTLYSLYAPVLMAHLEDTATLDARTYKVGDTTEERPLTKAETAFMLRLDALKIEQAATTLRAIAEDPSITELAGKYLGAAKAVERANVQLQNAMTDDNDATDAGHRLKQAILQRERVKGAIVSTLRAACQGCPDSDLFYLAQWSYRRVLNEPEKRLATFAAAADALDDLAKRFRTRSAELE
jgi:hypothetical protein